MFIEMSLGGVLLAGKWRTQDDLNNMSTEDQRNTLIVILSGSTNQSVGYFQGFDSDTLVGKGAVVVFLRESGIRDENGLKNMSDDDQRNTLIVVNNSNTGRSIGELQGLSNQDLVRIGLGESVVAAPQNGQVQELLAAHNRYRAEVGVPPLQWSDGLAASAQQWANHLAATGAFEHSGAGENLAQGSSGAFSATNLVDMWGGEKQYFIYGTFPDVSSSGNWGDVGHYTQLVWRNTTEVGCGLASGNGNDVLVCHYNPAGNVTGQGAF